MSTNLVTLATFDTSVKAEMAKAVLAESGIVAHLADENLVTMDWLLANAVGGVKLVVREEDAEEALRIYRDVEGHLNADPELTDAELERQAMEAEPESGEAE